MPFLAACLSALIIAPQAAGLQTKIRYTNQGAQAKAVLSDLSKASGVFLDASPQTSGEVLALRLVDIPLKEAMDRIAWAVDGTWRPEGAGFRLMRTPDQLRAEERAQLEHDAARYQRAIDARAKELSASPEFTKAVAVKIAAELSTILKSFNPDDHSGRTWARTRKLDQIGPPGKAVSRLAALLDPYDLAKLPPHYKIVYSTQPTPTQRPMGQKALSVIDKYIYEQGLWADEASKNSIQNPKFGSTTYILGGLTGSTERVDGQTGKVLLSVYKWSTESLPQLELMIANQKGKIIAEASGSLEDDPPPPGKAVPKPPPTSPPPPKVKVPASAIALSKMAQSSKEVVLTPEVLDALAHPEKTDPLGLCMGSILLAIAQFQKTSMVVDLPDRSIVCGTQLPEIVPSEYLSTMTHNLLERDISDGWLLLRPQFPVRERSLAIDRNYLGAYARKLSANGKLSLDDQAEFAMHTPEDDSSQLQWIVETAFGKSDNNSNEQNALRFYGSMSAEQRNVATKDGLTLTGFTPYQLHVLDRILNSESQNLQFNPSAENRPTSQADYELHYNGIYKLVTESLPSGPPPNTRLTIRIQGDDVAQSQPNSSAEISYGYQQFTPRDYAWHKFATERPDLFPWMREENASIDMAHLKFGKRTSYSLKFQFTPNLSLTQRLQSTDLGSGRTIAFDQLPETYRNEVAQRLDEYRKSYAHATAEGGSSPRAKGNIPPE